MRFSSPLFVFSDVDLDFLVALHSVFLSTANWPIPNQHGYRRSKVMVRHLSGKTNQELAK
jgi:hypothetical protein